MNIFEVINNNTHIGQKLYSPIIGVCYLRKITKYNNIIVSNSDNPCDEKAIELAFNVDGKFLEGGEILLFPSRVMKDWDKLTWEKGNSLKSSTTNQIVKFKDWNTDNYTEFRAYNEHNDLNVYCTVDFNKAIAEEPLRPGQRVLVRDAEDDEWKLHFFSHYQDGNTTLPICIGGDSFVWTIPYKGNQDLLGTTKSK